MDRSRVRRVLAWIGHALLQFVGTALVVVLVLATGLLAFHSRIVNNIYKNVGDLNDGEMPITATSYAPAPDIVGIIGGSGEGLNCSLPPFLDALFDGSADKKNNRHLVRQRFRQACVFHDLCYRHGLATYGYTQNDCDRMLQDHAYRLCLYIPNKDKTPERCQRDAKKVLAGVNLGGFGSYRGWDRSTFSSLIPIRCTPSNSTSAVSSTTRSNRSIRKNIAAILLRSSCRSSTSARTC